MGGGRAEERDGGRSGLVGLLLYLSGRVYTPDLRGRQNVYLYMLEHGDISRPLVESSQTPNAVTMQVVVTDPVHVKRNGSSRSAAWLSSPATTGSGPPPAP
jgi:hypothetical protein